MLSLAKVPSVFGKRTKNIFCLAPSIAYKVDPTQHKRHFDAFTGFGLSATLVYLIIRRSSHRLQQFLSSIGDVTSWKDSRLNRALDIHYDIIHDHQSSKISNSLKLPATVPSSVTRDVIIFFHDAPGGCDQYRCLSAAGNFHLPYTVIAVGRPGYLRGTFPKHQLSFQHVTQLHWFALRQLLGLGVSDGTLSKYRIHLCGYGYGGLYALHFAGRYPKAVSSLILLSAHSRIGGYAYHPIRVSSQATPETTRLLDGTALESLLTVQLLQTEKAAFISHIMDWVNKRQLKTLNVRGMIRLFEREFTSDSASRYADQCAKTYISELKGRQTKSDLPVPYTDEFAFTLMSALGYGASYQRMLGAVNDIANGADLNLDIESILQQQHASSWKRGLAKLHRHNHNDVALSSVTPELRPLEEDPLTPLFTTRDNEDFLHTLIQCPTLILHSPDDGKASFVYHARHAAAHIRGAQVETFTGLPHCLPLVDPERVSNCITSFVNGVAQKVP